MPREGSETLEQAAAERDQFVAAVRLLLDRGEVLAATEIAANSWRLWVLAHDEAGGRAFLREVLGVAEPAPADRGRALALYGDSLLAFRLGDLTASKRRSEAALQVARAAADSEAEALALLGLSRVALSEERPAEARAFAAASRARVRDLEPAMDQAPLHMLAQSVRQAGDDEAAAALFRESLELNRRIGDQAMVVVELHNLGHVELRLGRIDSAEQRFAECAALTRGDDAHDAAMALFNQAALALARGNHPGARELALKVRATLAQAGIGLAADDEVELHRLEQTLLGTTTDRR